MLTVGRKCSVSCHFCEVQPSQAKDAGARVGERRPWKAETASPGDGELCGEAGLSTSGSWRQVPGTCGVSSLSAAAPALAGSPNSEVPFLRATPGWLRITSGDGAQALLWPTCLL